MKTSTTEKVTRAYLVVLLVLALLVSSPLNFVLSLSLLILQLFVAFKPQAAGLNLVLTVATLVLAPLAIPDLFGVYTVLLVIPAVYLLSPSLKKYASTKTPTFSGVGRRASATLKHLSLGLFLVFVCSVIVWNFNLILITSVLLVCLGGLVWYVLRKVPKNALVEDRSWSRLLVGEAETRTFNISAKAETGLFVHLEPVNSWVKVEPKNFLLPPKTAVEATVVFAPPLAGPSKLKVNAVAADFWGLVETSQILAPLELHIIPRAKFAQWLAKKYLEQASFGAGLNISVQKSTIRVAKRGVEFHSTRLYQSGDRLKDIDWKHSYMLGDLIVKEYSGGLGNAAVVLVDLVAQDADSADKLAYNLVMAALTLAAEGIPTSIAAYTTSQVVAVTQMMASRELVKKALSLTEKIVIEAPKQKILGTASLRSVKSYVTRLNRLQSASAQNLSTILKFEADAIEQTAKTHPSTQALTTALKGLSGSAVLTVVSSNESEVLTLNLNRLQEKGYSAVTVNTKN